MVSDIALLSTWWDQITQIRYFSAIISLRQKEVIELRTTSCWWKTKFTATSLCRHSTSPHCHHLSHELNQAKALPCQGVCVTGGNKVDPEGPRWPRSHWCSLCWPHLARAPTGHCCLPSRQPASGVTSSCTEEPDSKLRTNHSNLRAMLPPRK